MNNILKLHLGSFHLVAILKGGCKLINNISVIKLIFKSKYHSLEIIRC